MLRPWIWSFLALIVAIFSVAAPAQRPQDRIVAVGDLHGDHDAWVAIARASGVVDSKGHWAGGRTTLVQVGDIVDRGPDSLKIIRDLMRLEKEAPRRGGRVIVLIGNHEAMMMTGDFRYVSAGEIAKFADRDSSRLRDMAFEANRAAIEKAYRTRTPNITPAAIRDQWFKETPLGMLEYRRAWQPDGELGSWTLGHKAVAIVGNSLFVHGGISADYLGLSIEEINRKVTEALKGQDASPTSIINDPSGPLWYRGLVTRTLEDKDAATGFARVHQGPRPTISQEIDRVIAAYGVKRIVSGHTPSLSGIIEDSGGKLWRIDSANSRAYGGVPSYLEIIGDRVTAHEVKRP
jgi:hypothetical protein